ncbi:hypothetical protein [Chitinophaga rhizosphaerae]|uniref:hypothetical protein n=1 Tax=Chitinophaga rhizosphaerae TaxID=1864947 RepID=UPI000F802C6C|nr:hypothetical protein [Chitinophaga rhizosphaerae]
MTIKCKGVFLEKKIILMSISIGLLALVLFLAVPALKGYLYFISMVLMFITLLYIFKLNRFDLLLIGVEQEEMHLSFINNSIFKRKDIRIRKELVKVTLENDKLIFSIDGQQQALVRKKAVSESDWEQLQKVLIH